MSAPKEDQDSAENGATPIYILEVGTWKITRKETSGDGPAIIWCHKAELQGNTLRMTPKDQSAGWSFGETKRSVRKVGKIETIKVEDDESWELNLDTLVWTHQKSEWQTVPKKKQKKSRGRRAI